jgi:hypothetical protein
MTYLDGPDLVTISDPGGANTRVVPVSDVQASEELNGVGEFSCFVRLEDLRAAGLGFDLQDRWLVWHGPNGFSFGGVIFGRPLGGGALEIEAEGWGSLLSGHMLLEYERVPEGGAAGLARRVVTEAGSVGPTFISIGLIDEGGAPISVTLGGSEVLDVLSDLSDEGDCEWIVDADRVFHAARRLGRDLSARVRLVEDRHFIEPDIAEDAWAAPPDEQFALESLEESARRRFLDEWGSIKGMDPQISLVAAIPEKDRNRHRDRQKHRRRRQGRRDDLPARRRHRGKGGGGRHANTPAPAPHWALSPVGVGANSPAIPGTRAIRLPTTPMGMTLIDIDGVWRHTALGNTVRVETLTGFAGRFRIYTRAIDMANGELHVAGEALADV